MNIVAVADRARAGRDVDTYLERGITDYIDGGIGQSRRRRMVA